jgi:hypothetical protein
MCENKNGLNVISKETGESKQPPLVVDEDALQKFLTAKSKLLNFEEYWEQINPGSVWNRSTDE